MTAALGDQHRSTSEAPTRACVAVIVHWTDAEATLACVAALRSGTVAPSLIVVDNASEDGSGRVLAERLRGVAGIDVLRAASNGGFGAGCNLGIERAISSLPGLAHVVLVNPDAVVAPDCIAALLDAARRHPDAGIVGGRVLDPTGTVVLYENGRFRPWTLGRSHAPAPRGRDEFETGFVTGALMLVDGALLRDGLRFDTTYFLYVEDLDFCREVVARGRRLWVTTRATCRHAEGGSQRNDPPLLGPMRARQLEQLTRGKVYFARKRLPWPQRLVFFAVTLLLKPIAGVLVARSPHVLGPYFRGVRAGLCAPLRRAR